MKKTKVWVIGLTLLFGLSAFAFAKPTFAQKDYGCYDFKQEQSNISTIENGLNAQIATLVDSVGGKLEAPENAAIAKKVANLISQRDKAHDERKKYEEKYKKCVKKNCH